MDDEGPAFISFSGLPDEDVHDFVSSVESLRKHFKWSNQVAFCYARTMLKGIARKTIQTAKPAPTATSASSTNNDNDKGEAQKARTLGDEAIDPNSWPNLKAALTFEFSDQYQQDRALVQLLNLKQQTGESSSEYAQRFVSAMSTLVAAHPLDSKLLAVHFANGLRSEKTRWELLLRRLDTIDKAVAFVAPEHLYKVAKLTPLLSPPPTHPSSVNTVGELSPTSDSSSSFTASTATTTPTAATGSTSSTTTAASGAAAAEPRKTVIKTVSTPDGSFNITAIAAEGRHTDAIDKTYSYSSETDDDLLLDSGVGSVRGYTANGASFSLDDDFEGAGSPQTPMPYPANQGGMMASAHENGFWTPPRLPDAQQRRHHRQSMSTYALTHSASISNFSNARPMVSSHNHHTWTPAAAAAAGVARQSRSMTPVQSSSPYALGGPGAYMGHHSHQYNGEDHDDEYSSYSMYDASGANDGMVHQRLAAAGLDAGSETDDGSRSATELNNLADQLESLSSMLRVQSDSRRRRPRLCYRCRQKGHIAAECPLPSDVVVPNQQLREKLGILPSSLAVVPRGTTAIQPKPAPVVPSSPQPSSAPSSSMTWRSGNVALQAPSHTNNNGNNNNGGGSRAHGQSGSSSSRRGGSGGGGGSMGRSTRRYTQTLNWNAKQQTHGAVS
ncbi:hypothetical protein GGI11_006111 [Coemansia sp. RSA 2049]|nr:hypothetical protein GGI11_006111 [Coemansia sp. RSA 2049]